MANDKNFLDHTSSLSSPNFDIVKIEKRHNLQMIHSTNTHSSKETVIVYSRVDSSRRNFQKQTPSHASKLKCVIQRIFQLRLIFLTCFILWSLLFSSYYFFNVVSCYFLLLTFRMWCVCGRWRWRNENSMEKEEFFDGHKQHHVYVMWMYSHLSIFFQSTHHDDNDIISQRFSKDLNRCM
jgi:hypothetical protein